MPYVLLSSIEEELDRLVREEIIENVVKSDWAAPIVIVTKAGHKVRLCGDYKVTVNPYLEDET